MAYSTTTRLSSRTIPSVPSPLQPSEWRCHECGKLLGVRHGARLHIRLQRHSYLVSLPVDATCHGCGTPNRT
jgi:RNase P subunit RPR2